MPKKRATKLRLLPVVTRAGDADLKQQVVAMLKDYLNRAKAGEFNTAMVVFTKMEGPIVWDSTGFRDITTQIGAVELLKHSLLARQIDESK